VSDPYDLMAGWNWLDQQPGVRWLPIKFEDRQKLALCYWHARSCGYDHRSAKRAALKGYGSAWIYAMYAALWVLFKLLERWWENRNVD